MNKFHFSPDELAIINALVLGQRQGLPTQIYTSYVQAGAVHILAVSGLHVGLILMLLNILLKPITYLKKGKLIKIILTLTVLWSYAIIAGLSASVVRAVSMFSIVAIGMYLQRQSAIYNTLFVSLFILLVFQPTYIFDIGFQLSYLAVFAIVTFQPMLYSLVKVPYRLLEYPWKLFTVSLSAQIGITPISLYYFHQFPGLFFISNLIIIPLLGTILGLGILIIILALAKWLPIWFAEIYGSIITMMTTFVRWIAQHEAFLFKNISFSISQVLFCYLLLGWFLILRSRRTYKNAICLLITILLFQFHFLYQKQRRANKKLIIFHKNRYSIIGIQQHKTLEIHTNIETITQETFISNYCVGAAVNLYKIDSIQAFYKLGSRSILVVDSLAIYNIKQIQPEIIVLRNSPKLNLVRLIDSLQPQLILADGSNYASYIQRWHYTCLTKKIPFHHTGKKGAYSLKD
ncbi:MAG: ComEC/Rec2 family competence protein [Flavobacteriaceae bacterium]|nr:ComEC/Rec2 family competence protein [Flavobacteriaceae bacterium]